jgi:N-glycosylase/DNA lyase
MLPFTISIPLNAPLNLHATLFCGQAFRWQIVSENNASVSIYQAVLYDAIVQLSEHGEMLHISSTHEFINSQTLDLFIINYLGLNDSLHDVFTPAFQEKYPTIYKGASAYFGLRLLRQPPFETLISFMCAQGMGVKLIRRQVMLLCKNLGSQIEQHFFPITDYKFPMAKQLAGADLEILRRCTNNNSIRAKNIQAVAKAVASGALSLEQLCAPQCSVSNARNELMKYNGIGAKIADCVCLFGLGHLNAFPIDTHVRQYLDAWFDLRSQTKSLTDKGYEKLCDEARLILGEQYAGFAGQILFHYWRKDVRGMTAF